MKKKWLILIHAPLGTWLIRATLVLVVCFMIAVITPIIQSAKAAAASTRASRLAKTVDTALFLYMGDSEVLPKIVSGGQVTPLISPYFQKANSMQYENQPLEELNGISRSYDWNVLLSGLSLTEIADPRSTWIFKSGKSTKMRERVAGYADGHAQWINDYMEAKLITDPNKTANPQTGE